MGSPSSGVRPLAPRVPRVVLVGLALGLARAGPGGDGLEAAQAAASAEPAPAQGQRFRQSMKNFGDVQYVANITVGGQTLGGIFDTGSFELVVFAHTCSSCGLAGVYAHLQSPHYREGTLVATHTYGSGNLYSLQAFDRIQIGPISSPMQAFWEVTGASMPLLDNANFAAIVGIGPPAVGPVAAVPGGGGAVVSALPPIGDPGFGAPGLGEPTPRAVGFLGSMNVSLFSVCLGARPGSDGYLIWNDADPRERPGVFSGVKVVGTRSWGVLLGGAKLSHSLFSVDLGCGNGCGAILDSGTSLLVVPPAVVDQVSRAVESLNADCSNLHVLPTLNFNLGGKDYSLPPDSYVGDEGDVPRGTFGSGEEAFRAPHKCRLLLMETDTQTQFGPMWVLGMPFFRRYYTTFDLGRNGRAQPQAGAEPEAASPERWIFTARSGPLCTPQAETTPPATSLLSLGRRQAPIDTSKAMVSPWIQAAAAEDFVNI